MNVTLLWADLVLCFGAATFGILESAINDSIFKNNKVFINYVFIYLFIYLFIKTLFIVGR